VRRIITNSTQTARPALKCTHRTRAKLVPIAPGPLKTWTPKSKAGTEVQCRVTTSEAVLTVRADLAVAAGVGAVEKEVLAGVGDSISLIDFEMRSR
jgi:hypothetical protein